VGRSIRSSVARTDRVGGLHRQLNAFSRLPPPEKFCAALEFFGLPTRGRRAHFDVLDLDESSERHSPQRRG
jgi:hypothetical protein